MDSNHHMPSGSLVSAIISATAATATNTPSSTMSDMNTGGMDMSDSSSSMSGMSMSMGTFHWSSIGDGIWLDSWVPSSEGAYIGACFGLFFCSIFSRSLPAIEAYFITWKAMRDNESLLTRTHQVSATTTKGTDVEKLPVNSPDDVSSNSLNPTIFPEPKKLPMVPAFSFTNDTIRSLLTTLTTFVGYLMMMIVMTGNGGYFLVIMLGVFVGEMLFGRFRALYKFTSDHSH